MTQISRKGAILDFDGTLLDSISAWHDLDRNFLNKYGILNEKNLNAMENSSTIEYAADYLLGIGLPKSRESIIAEIRGMISDAYRFQLQLFPGAREFLQARVEAGWKLGLLTAAPKALVEAALERLDIAGFFKVILCDADKHTDEPFLQIAKDLGVQPNETVVCDDQVWVLERARALGFHVESDLKNV